MIIIIYILLFYWLHVLTIRFFYFSLLPCIDFLIIMCTLASQLHIRIRFVFILYFDSQVFPFSFFVKTWSQVIFHFHVSHIYWFIITHWNKIYLEFSFYFIITCIKFWLNNVQKCIYYLFLLHDSTSHC